MKEKKKRRSPLSYSRYTAFVLAIMIVALLLTVVRVIAVMRDYEPSVQYFKLGSLLAITFNGGAVALVAAAFVLPLFVAKERFVRAPQPTGSRTLFFAFFSAAALAVFAVFEAKDFFTRGDPNAVMATGQSFTARFHTVSGICLLLAVGLIVYLVMTALGKPSDPRVRAAVGCIGVAFLVFRLLALYFDTSAPINSPIKTLDQMANSAALLFLAGELRLTISDARPRFSLQTALAAFVLLLPSSVSQMVGSFSGVLPLDTKTLYALFEFAFALYCASRLMALLLAKRRPAEAPAPAPSEPAGEKTSES